MTGAYMPIGEIVGQHSVTGAEFPISIDANVDFICVDAVEIEPVRKPSGVEMPIVAISLRTVGQQPRGEGPVVIEIEALAHLLDVYTNGAIHPRFLDEWTFDSWALVPERFNLPGPLSAIYFNAPVQMALAITVTEYPAL